jgi:hypothetical protein
MPRLRSPNYIYNKGINARGDAAIARAREAYDECDPKVCLAALGVGMKAFGWDRYPNAPGALEARSLWVRWADICHRVRAHARDAPLRAPAINASDHVAIADAIYHLFGDVFTTVNGGPNHRRRKNLPPWHPDAKY